MKFAPAIMRMWSHLGPSGALGAAAIELGAKREDVFFLSADMTFAAGLEGFRNRYPDRHFEVGIAEQNMIGMAAGFASEGFIPFAVTYSTFLTTRALDQIKMCLGYMKFPVKLIGLNAGLAAGILGPTHMALEDISALRAIPNITILSPADTTETVKAIMAAIEHPSPIFIRLTGEVNQPQVYTADYEYEIGKAIELRAGTDVAIIATGSVVYNCLQAAEKLEKNGISCSVTNMHTIKPLDTKAIERNFDKNLIVTVEEHNVYGGIGSAVAEVLSDNEANLMHQPMQLKLGVRDIYPHAASYKKLMSDLHLDTDGIASEIEMMYRKVAR